MKTRLLCAAAALAVAVPAFATTVGPQVVYTVALTGTKEGNDVTDVFLVEQYGPNSYRFQREGTLSSEGQTILSSSYIGQFKAAVVGLEFPTVPTVAGVTAAIDPHIVFAMDNTFAEDVVTNEKRFSQSFPPAHESTIRDAIAAWYERDDSASFTMLQSFFANEARGALFNVPGPFTVMEYSLGVPVGSGGSTSPVPEPATLVLASIGTAAVWLVRKKVGSQATN